MGFYDLLDHVVELLRHRGRVTYRALKREFNLDDTLLEDVKAELLYTHPEIVDDHGRGLLWTGETVVVSASSPSRVADAETRFHAVFPVLARLLQQEGRLTYRTLKQIFGINNDFVEDLRNELTLDTKRRR